MDVFEQRKKTLEVQSLVRRVIDISSPNVPPEVGEMRKEERKNRTIPILMVPFVDNKPVMDEVDFALTKDLSSRGASVIVKKPTTGASLVAGFHTDSGWSFVYGNIDHITQLELGFWQIGIEFLEIIYPEDHVWLQGIFNLVERLTPILEPEAPDEQVSDEQA